MKIFDKDNKINFVDENNVFLGYDMYQGCCEHADWFIADTPQTSTQTRSDDNPDLTGFQFDTTWFQDSGGGGEFDSGGMAIFRITNGEAEKFIHLFNCHNGYYGHGFEFTVPGGAGRTGCL